MVSEVVRGQNRGFTPRSPRHAHPDGRARPSRRRIAGLRRHAARSTRPKGSRCRWSPRRAASAAAIAASVRAIRPSRRARARRHSRGRAARGRVGARRARRRRCSTIGISSSIAPNPREAVAAHRRHSCGAFVRDVVADVRARRRLRPSRSHRDLAVHDGGDRRRGRSGVRIGGDGAAPPHAVSKLYYIAWPESTWAAYQAAFKKLTSTVDGVERQATPWPDWAITTVIDTRDVWPTVWRAVSCHESQMPAYERLNDAVAGASRGAVGPAVVLSRVQHRERRTRARDGSVRRDRQTMTTRHEPTGRDRRHAPLAMDAATFRALGHRLVDQLAELLESLPRGR